MEISHKYAQNGDIRLHYATAGTGEPVYLLHGFPEHWYSWRKQIEDLSGNYQVIAPDLRGYNLSDKPKGWKNYLPAALVTDLKAIMQAEGHQKIRLVAHDWGGAVGWEMGIHHPDLLEQLVIINSPHPHIFGKALKTNNRQRRRSWYMFLFQIPVLPELGIRLFLRKFMRSSLRGWSHNPEAFSDEDLAKYVQAFRQKGAIRASLDYYRAGFRGRKLMTPGNDNPIQVPTLVIWGENDIALGLELTDDIPAYMQADYRLETIPDCSHWVQSDHPKKVCELLTHFFMEGKA